MKTKAILLNSGAIVMFLGATLLAIPAPAVAQSDLNPPQYSSPAERAETQQLNEQNANGTNATPAQLNGEASTPLPGSYGSEQPPYGSEQPDQQSQYQQQMQQYQDQQQQYQDQRNQYENQKAEYRHELRWYDQARWNYDYPHAYAYEFDGPRLRYFSMIRESSRLADVPVEGPDGAWVGRIRNVETAPDGRPIRVEISLNHRVSVWVDPRDLRFDPDEDIAYTDLTRHALWDMPGATVASEP
jgi:hypothetical protein